jgi:hypothetical protein
VPIAARPAPINFAAEASIVRSPVDQGVFRKG